jgi:HD-GYP domain-containing protein (c-di-GMP phosphodiesterase class II)
MSLIRRFIPQPLTALAVSGLALLSLAGAWRAQPISFAGSTAMEMLVLALALGSAVVMADLRPIHVHYHTKIAVSSIPLFAIAALLPPPLAALIAGGSRLIGDLLERKRRGNLPSDIATSAGRWVILGLAGSWVAHLPAQGATGQALVLFLSAAVMLLADLCTSVLEIAPISGEPPRRVLRSVARESTPIEVIQYLLGILGVLAAIQYPWALLLLLVPIVFVHNAFKHTRELHDRTRALLEGMADAVDLRDPYTGGHSRRVAELCAGMLREISFTGPDAELIIAAARVHDIGKIGIPDGILNKPGPLTLAERALMETHAARGADLLARYPDFARGVAIVRHHHERWDGKGYPDGKAAYDIPFGARVMAIADSFDAMISNRPYRRGMTPARAAAILREGRGTQWDAQLVDVFLRSIVHPLEPADPRIDPLAQSSWTGSDRGLLIPASPVVQSPQ